MITSASSTSSWNGVHPWHPAAPCASPFVVTGRDAATMARVEAATRQRIAFYASTSSYRSLLDVHGWAGRAEQLTKLSKQGEWTAMADLVDDEMLHAFAVVAEPDALGEALRRRWAGRVGRIAIFTAADPGAEVWPAALAGSVWPAGFRGQSPHRSGVGE